MTTYTLLGTAQDTRRNLSITYFQAKEFLSNPASICTVIVTQDPSQYSVTSIHVELHGILRYQQAYTLQRFMNATQQQRNRLVNGLTTTAATIRDDQKLVWKTAAELVCGRIAKQLLKVMSGIPLEGNGTKDLNVMIVTLVHSGYLLFDPSTTGVLVKQDESESDIEDLVRKIENGTVTYLPQELEPSPYGYAFPSTRPTFKFISTGTSIETESYYHIVWSRNVTRAGNKQFIFEDELISLVPGNIKCYHVAPTMSWPHIHIFPTTSDFDAYLLHSFRRTLIESISSGAGSSSLGRILHVPLTNTMYSETHRRVLQACVLIQTIQSLSNVPTSLEDIRSLVWMLSDKRSQLSPIGSPILSTSYLVDLTTLLNDSNFGYTFLSRITSVDVEDVQGNPTEYQATLPKFLVVNTLPFGTLTADGDLPAFDPTGIEFQRDLTLRVAFPSLFTSFPLLLMDPGPFDGTEGALTTIDMLTRLTTALRSKLVASARQEFVKTFVSPQTLSGLFYNAFANVQIHSPIVGSIVHYFLTGEKLQFTNDQANQTLLASSFSTFRTPAAPSYNTVSDLLDIGSALEFLYHDMKVLPIAKDYSSLDQITGSKKNVLLIGGINNYTLTLINQALFERVNIIHQQLTGILGAGRNRPGRADISNNYEMVIFNYTTWSSSTFGNHWTEILGLFREYANLGIQKLILRLPGISSEMYGELYQIVHDLNRWKFENDEDQSYMLYGIGALGQTFLGVTPVLIMEKGGTESHHSIMNVAGIHNLRRFSLLSDSFEVPEMAMVNVSQIPNNWGEIAELRGSIIYGSSSEEQSSALVTYLLHFVPSVKVFRTGSNFNPKVTAYGIMNDATRWIRARSLGLFIDTTAILEPTALWNGSVTHGDWNSNASILSVYDETMKSSIAFSTVNRVRMLIDIGGRRCEGLRFCQNNADWYVNYDPAGMDPTEIFFRCGIIRENWAPDVNLDAVPQGMNIPVGILSVVAINSIFHVGDHDELEQRITAIGAWIRAAAPFQKRLLFNIPITPSESQVALMSEFSLITYRATDDDDIYMAYFGTYDPVTTIRLNRVIELLAVPDTHRVTFPTLNITRYLESYHMNMWNFMKSYDTAIGNLSSLIQYILIEPV